MNKSIYLSLFFLTIANLLFSQSIDDSFSQEEMMKDLKAFKQIRTEANSGLYKYRTKQEIDSIYVWAESEIKSSSTVRDFYNIICELTDFEGSCHNSTSFSPKFMENFKAEASGYFPYPLKWIDGKWRLNFDNGAIPLGSEIIEINHLPISEIISKLNKYHTTDGQNLTGKRVGMRGEFSKSFRLNYGKFEEFHVTYKRPDTDSIDSITLESIGYRAFFNNVGGMHSMPMNRMYYADLKEDQKYKYEQVDDATGCLTIYTFGMGNETTDEHKTYVAFLDSIFSKIKTQNVQNLIVDVRNNSGGTDPNDLVTYSYLTKRNFQENKQAWISFKKIPLLKYVFTKVPRFLRPLGVRKYNRTFTEDFYIEKGSSLYQGPLSADQKIRKPSKYAFTGKVYLLIGPQVASAGSLFAALVVGNENTTSIGEETVGGYYGHNGHRPLAYVLPKSKIKTVFSVVNLEQDVPKKDNQMYNRGIIPDIDISQTFEDYLVQKDTQMDFTLELIKKNQAE